MDLRKEDTFSGTITIAFQMTKASDQITVDFSNGSIDELAIDGSPAKLVYNKYFITLPSLTSGEHRVDIRFSHKYSSNGDGFYRFIDPEDKRVYLYSHFEPYKANNMFPCFDQPDIKARFKLNVQAPESWQVISANLPEKATARDGFKQWQFPWTAPFSTYVFSLHAGDYKMWTDTLAPIPSRLFARQSLAKYVNVEKWFSTTRAGMKFFNNYFAYPYPFLKYDQVIVPDFNEGAMENVAAVTFSEQGVSRGKATRADDSKNANILLHEMAHMWFGNLVTMRWWNDLWLNESFATYMATMAQIAVTEYREGWHDFFTHDKQWAYWKDQMVTSHPIVNDVDSAEDAITYFDGISYGKGAASLKQLAFFLGGDAFQAGLRAYLSQHAYANATLAEFIGALEKSSQKSLQNWAHAWLNVASLNDLSVEVKCDQSGKIGVFNLRQAAEGAGNQLRPHKTVIGLYDLDKSSGKIVLYHKLPVTYENSLTPVPQLIGQKCPLLIQPNQEDYDYVKVTLDPTSLTTVKAHLSSIKDDFVRMMLWQSLWDMVIDGKLSALTYHKIAIEHLPHERDIDNLSRILATLHGKWPGSLSVFSLMPNESASERQQFEGMAQHLADFCWQQLRTSKPGSDLQKLWLKSFMRSALNRKSQGKLIALLDRKLLLPKLTLDQDLRWQIVQRLAMYGSPGAKSFIDKESKADASSRGKNSALSAMVSLPNANLKKHYFSQLTAAETPYTFAEEEVILWNLFPYNQAELAAPYTKLFFDQLLDLHKQKKSARFLSSFAEGLAPRACTSDNITSMGAFITRERQNLFPGVVIELLESKQMLERCLSIRKLLQ